VTRLAAIGALNFESHRRGALWQAGLRPLPSGGLFGENEPESGSCPLDPMTSEERLRADFAGTGLTIGRHPMSYQREAVRRMGALSAAELAWRRNGSAVRVAGCVIVRQRPGTAKGFVFLSMEDETGISNIIVQPPIFEKYRSVLVTEPFLFISGVLQNLDGVVSVRAKHVEALVTVLASAKSHDFH
jgi:error-prone DNA polymerase